MLLETYLLYLAAVAVFFATPPCTSQLLIISNSIRHGQKRSMFTVVGDLTANCIQMICAAFGLAAIIATSATAFTLIKWLGVLYLAWIGLQLMFTKEHSGDVEANPSASSFRLFQQGFYTSLANPLAVVFFAALFPQFIDAALPISGQLIILGGTYLIIDGVLLLVWGWAGVRAASLLKCSSLQVINKLCGGLMVIAAVLLASKDIQPQK